MNDRLFHLRHWMYHVVEDRLTVSVRSKINGPAKDNIIYCCALHAVGGAVVQRVRHLGLRSVGREFKSCSRQRCVTTLGKLFTPMCLCHQAV